MTCRIKPRNKTNETLGRLFTPMILSLVLVMGCSKAPALSTGSTSNQLIPSTSNQIIAPQTTPPQITAADVSIAIAPTVVGLAPNGVKTFKALVNGTTDFAANWSIKEGSAGGSIDSSGVYTAPAIAGTYHVIATAHADPMKSAVATVTVSESVFNATGAMLSPRAAHTATLLPNGKVLIVDGGQLDIDDLLVSINSAELYDPSSRTFAPTGSTSVAREFHTATLLQNGKVLITGGNEFNGYPTWLNPTPSVEVYDPGAGQFTNVGNMAVGRAGHTATLLMDGRVLIAGGSSEGPAAELYDPATGLFTSVTGMHILRLGHTATLLPTGKVLIVGGQDVSGKSMLPQFPGMPDSSAEIFDPNTDSFTWTGSMVEARTHHTATLLPSGAVLVAGGWDPAGKPAATAELYDPTTGLFTPVGNLATGRVGHTATLLPDGTVLVAGGEDQADESPFGATWQGYFALSTTEIFDTSTAAFKPSKSMTEGRFWQSATLLPSGAVLLAGGVGADLPLASAETDK